MTLPAPDQKTEPVDETEIDDVLYRRSRPSASGLDPEAVHEVPRVCYSAAVEREVQTADQVDGYEAVVIPKRRLTDDRVQTVTKEHGIDFDQSYAVMNGVRFRNDRIVTVKNGTLTECKHRDTEPIPGKRQRRCQQCGRTFAPKQY